MIKHLLSKTFFFLFLLSPICFIHAQQTFPQNGVYDQRDGLYAFTNATIYVSYQQKLEEASLLIKKGKVLAVGQQIDIPKDAVVLDLKGKVIYPSFIDLYTNYGLPKVEIKPFSWAEGPQTLSKKKGAYSWNQSLNPEYSAHEHFTVDDKSAGELRKLGFGSVMSHLMDGISRGSGTVVALGKDKEHLSLLKMRGAHYLSFRKGSSKQSYPSSLMGAIALLRQTYYDGLWYSQHGYKEERNISLEAWNEAKELPQIFAVRNRLEALRALRIAQEFQLNYIIKGSGDEYQRLEEFQKANTTFILPINFPATYDVEDPYDASTVTLAQLKHWELAPSNPARLAKAGLDFTLTTDGLKKKSDFWKNLRKAVQHGLTESDALKALTHTPAKLSNMLDQLGSLEKGKLANFIICSKSIFEKDSKIHHNWIQGKAHIIKPLKSPLPEGIYQLSIQDDNYSLHLSNQKSGQPKLHIQLNDSTAIKVKSSWKGEFLNFSFKLDEAQEAPIRLSGIPAAEGWSGNGSLASGQWVNWKARRTGPLPAEEKEKKEKKEEEATPKTGEVIYPFVAFGWTEAPKQQTVLIKNATVWTNEADGILNNTDVLLEKGKISKVGQNLNTRGATVIDGTGKHLTCGIIDEHSHIAISRGVNEGTQASSAEVSIGDVVDSEDIDIYRQLAGGVTTSQLLHGSANPIGGQSAIIKLRWGYTPEQMKFEGAAPFIKFALGENVKQSNWGDRYNKRFPQTRMGVEQVFEDYFTRAKEYGEKIRSDRKTRRDLDLEAVLEIVEGKRFISCHSYQQGEINMLMKVAERHGFTVNTFTHILEGYKVADKMAKHGAGGSTFSDWWAYKYEVIDAIPYNAAIMHNQGVLTAINSDDAEMARRLNQEAAKAVMYGDVPEEDAWKFVTLNPAKLLHIDDQVGSIKVGKDADVVIWSDNPLSIYAKAEMTFIDGIKFFDREEDVKMQAEVLKERTRLINKSLADKKSGKATQSVKGRKPHHYHCDDIHDEMAH
ncbi:MAG: amidohydrolase family protein [Bacteroidota bacterium]